VSCRFARAMPLALSGVLAALAPVGQSAATPTVNAQDGAVRMEWLGWSFFRFTSPGGKVILTNPVIQGNADAAVSLDDVTQADLAAAIQRVATDNPNLPTLMPHPHRVNPAPGAATIPDVRAALDAMGVGIPITDQVRSQVYEFTK